MDCQVINSVIGETTTHTFEYTLLDHCE